MPDDMTEDEETIEAIQAWLEAKHTTLWGRAFDLSNDNGALHAAQWLYNEIDDLARCVGAA